VFYLNVAKVDLNVAMSIHVCCKHLFQMYLMVSDYVASVLSGYCICYHTYVASVSSGCCIYLQCLSSGFKCLRRMLQVFQLFRTYVESVSSGYCKSRFNVVHVAMESTCRSRLLHCWGAAERA
jgi:hypothetical protein